MMQDPRMKPAQEEINGRGDAPSADGTDGVSDNIKDDGGIASTIAASADANAHHLPH